jgi:hypothetical protein
MTVGANNWMPLAADRYNVLSTGIAINFQYCDQLMVMWTMIFQQDALGNFDWSRTLSAAVGGTTLTNVTLASSNAIRLIGQSTVNIAQQGVVFINNRENTAGERTISFNSSTYAATSATQCTFGAGARVRINEPITAISIGGLGNNTIRTGSAKLAVFGSNII